MVGTSFKAWVEKKRGQNLIFSLTVHDFSGTRVVRAGGGEGGQSVHFVQICNATG